MIGSDEEGVTGIEVIERVDTDEEVKERRVVLLENLTLHCEYTILSQLLAVHDAWPVMLPLVCGSLPLRTSLLMQRLSSTKAH